MVSERPGPGGHGGRGNDGNRSYIHARVEPGDTDASSSHQTLRCRISATETLPMRFLRGLLFFFHRQDSLKITGAEQLGRSYNVRHRGGDLQR